ncbi:MAG TPA: AGE family epimerase/isomerase [Lachnospiraceae bacterium]|nr:AGE family epimerase/isomerase [Lachnospiraceae bacterium]
MTEEIQKHLTEVVIPFWKGLRDNEYGGYYGWLDFDLNLDQKAPKGCILNSRIMWFFANAYMVLKDESLLDEAKHAYEFMKKYCVDETFGGVYWAVNYDGTLNDSTKHTYNQAFSIYALSSYYNATGDEEALKMARDLFALIEERCTDEIGYLEAFTRVFTPESNEKLSENGVMAEKTMNTLLHVMEAYTELYRVSKDEAVGERIRFIMDIIMTKLYNPEKQRQEVFFDANYNSILDMHSYGHDIEASWLIDRALEVLDNKEYTEKLRPITQALTKKIYERAYVNHSLMNECVNGVDDTHRIWWVQAESVVGFLNGYEKDKTKTEYLQAARDIWKYIQEYIVDHRVGSEWFWRVDENGQPDGMPIVEPWKCPYHNGRMCLECIKRGLD